MKNQRLKNTFKYVLAIGIIVLAFFLLKLSKPVGDGIRSGLALSANVIIPSLFPFMVLASFISFSFISEKLSSLLSPITTKVFGLPKQMGAVLLMSFVGGYPVGARMLSGMVESKKISGQTAERMLCFCVNAGPSFILSAIGASMLGSIQLGVILFSSHVLASLTVGFLLARFRTPSPQPAHAPNTAQPLYAAFVSAVCSSASSVISICAFIVLFSGMIAFGNSTGLFLGLSKFLHTLIPFGSAAFWEGLITGILEVTTGCARLAESGAVGASTVVLISFFLSFGSLSIIFQIMFCFKGLSVSMKPFLISRFVCGVLSAVFAFLLLKIFGEGIVAVAAGMKAIFVLPGPVQIITILCMLGMCSILLMSVNKS